MFAFYELQKRLSVYLSEKQILPVARAYLYAADAHETQFRSSGEPYVTHTLAAASILADMHLDPDTIMAALLHDVLEDTHTSFDDIAKHFGEKVARLVEGVTKLTQIHFESRKEAQAENFRKMMLAMTGDVRVILIKMADRLHNMSTIASLPAKKRYRIALETMEIYAPIAHRLGMNHFKLALEDYSFQAMYPWRYAILKEYVARARRHRKHLFEKVENTLMKTLGKLGVSPSQIIGREKSLTSVYRKMRDRGVPFSEIMDLFGFRILTHSTAECYQLLGVVHSIFKPIPGKFKDYIAIPKANGYQSLHTLLFGPYGVPLEIQLRTKDMDHIAENGIAAHWQYKIQNDAAALPSETNAWLQKVADLEGQTNDALEFIQNMKMDLFPDEIYVFTPKGEILSLPRGATALDYAYAVHTEVGDHCKEVIINRRPVPLSYPLLNGQSVEVITDPTLYPNATWLHFVVTGKAKSSIRHALKEGQERALLPEGQAPLSQLKKKKPLIVIHSSKGMNLDFAHCCQPIPGDPVKGFYNAAHKIIVHVSHCEHLEDLIAQKNHGKWVEVEWSQQVTGFFPVRLTVIGQNNVGVIAGITREIAELGGNIREFNLHETLEIEVHIDLIVEVQDRAHLAKMIRSIRRLTYVKRVWRGLNDK